MEYSGGKLKGLDVIEQVMLNHPHTSAYLISNETPEDMIPEVKQRGGVSAYEPSWSIHLLEKILKRGEC